MLLNRVAPQADRKMCVIAYQRPVHRNKTVRAWPKANAERVKLHLIPGYSLELNLEELLDVHLKRNANVSAHNVDRLAHETSRFLHRHHRGTSSATTPEPNPHVRYVTMQETEYFRLNGV